MHRSTRCPLFLARALRHVALIQFPTRKTLSPMNPRNHILALAFVVLGATVAQASVTVTVNSNGGPTYTTSAGSALADGSIIRVGLFNTSGGNLATLQTSNDFATIDSLFTPFAESGHPGSGAVNQSSNAGNQIIINSLFGPGQVIGNIEGIAASYSATGSQIYVWVFNSANTGTATEWGIFSATSGWNFPSDLGQETLSTFEVNDIVRGSTTGGITSADQLRLSSIAAVPEASSSMLLLTTGLIALRRRRR